jgi:hypothetical protein
VIYMRFRTRFMMLSAALMGCAFLAGCVASESSRYERKLTSRVQAKPHASGDVSIAFGLDGRDEQPTALAGAPTDR